MKIALAWIALNVAFVALAMLAALARKWIAGGWR